jgi:uncharacterized protein YecE (DUF72 family)
VLTSGEPVTLKLKAKKLMRLLTNLHLGCPVWNCDQWADVVYPIKTPRREWLRWYSKAFNTVEGNSTFYGLPSHETVQRWCEETLDGFQFCFKFPRSISHEGALVGVQKETRDFLAVLDILARGNRLGPTFLQLGPEFGPDRLPLLENYLDQLPKEHAWAVEVRHAGWFDSGANEHRLQDSLCARNIDTVLFDSRPLYQSPPEDDIERESQRRKPKTPLRHTVTGQRPMLRLIGRNRVELVDAFIDEWTEVVAGWIGRGLRPFVFTHAPDDAMAPQFARRFASRLAKHMNAPQLELPTLPTKSKQLDLF